jgi:hypothetical protein
VCTFWVPGLCCCPHTLNICLLICKYAPECHIVEHPQTVNTEAFWYVTLCHWDCSLWCFEGLHCLHFQGEAVQGEMWFCVSGVTYPDPPAWLGLPDPEDEGTMTLQNILSYSPNDTEWHSRRHKSAVPWWETLITFLAYIALLRWETKFHTHFCRTYVCQIRGQKNLNWTGFTFIVVQHTTASLRPVAWCHEMTQSLPAWVAALLVIAVPASCT